MDKTTRSLAIGLILLIILTPLGLLATGETFGEWSNKEVKEKLGFVPIGLDHLSSLWDAPLQDYTLPGESSGHGAVAIYILSAVIGALLCAGLLYFVGNKLAKG